MKNQALGRPNSQSGSVLILIFICIGLFAALSFVMSQGFRSGESGLTEQQAKLAATEIIEYLNKVKSTFDTLTIGGCDPLKIDFSTSYYAKGGGSAADTAPAGTTEACGLYTSTGGKISPVTFTEHAATAYSPGGSDIKGGHASARYVDGSGLGTTANDLAFMFAGIDQKICLAALNMSRTTDSTVTSVPTSSYTVAGSNSYTQGAAGSLTALAMPTTARIWAVKASSGDTWCTIGIILKVN